MTLIGRYFAVIALRSVERRGDAMQTFDAALDIRIGGVCVPPVPITCTVP